MADLGMLPIQFEQACSTTARAMSRKKKVTVSFGGTDAHTVKRGDTVHITLPSLDHSKTMTPEEVSVTRGYVDHESAHGLETDLDLWSREMGAAKRRKDHLLMAAMNACEDLRIEKRMIEEYPGARKNLAALADAVAQGYLEGPYKENPAVANDIKMIGAIAATWVGRKRLGLPCDRVDDCLSTLPKDVLEKAENWANAIDGVSTTADAIALAKIMCEEQRDGEPPPPEGDGEGDEEGGGEGDEEGGGSGKPKGRNDGGENKKGKPGGVGGGGDIEMRSFENGVIDPTLQIEDFLDIPDVLGTSGYRPLTTKFDRTHHRKDAVDKYRSMVPKNLKEMIADATRDRVYANGYKRYDSRHGGPVDVSGQPLLAEDVKSLENMLSRYNSEDYITDCSFGARWLANENGLKNYLRYRGQIARHIGVMSKKLGLSLMDKRRRQFTGGYEAGRLDARRLIAATTGFMKVFKQREDTDDLNTAVSLVIDCSGSMRGAKIIAATQCAMAIAEAVEPTGVPFEIVGFGTMSGGPVESIIMEQVSKFCGERYDRRGILDFFEFKRFDETLHQCKQALGNAPLTVQGSNIDGESVVMALERLLRREENKKIMVVLSDGLPAYATDTGAAHQNLRDSIAMCTAHGVNVIGVGIRSDAVSQFYPNYVVLNDIADLSGAVIDKVSMAMTGQSISKAADLIKAGADSKGNARRKRVA